MLSIALSTVFAGSALVASKVVVPQMQFGANPPSRAAFAHSLVSTTGSELNRDSVEGNLCQCELRRHTVAVRALL